MVFRKGGATSMGQARTHPCDIRQGSRGGSKWGGAMRQCPVNVLICHWPIKWIMVRDTCGWDPQPCMGIASFEPHRYARWASYIICIDILLIIVIIYPIHDTVSISCSIIISNVFLWVVFSVPSTMLSALRLFSQVILISAQGDRVTNPPT